MWYELLVSSSVILTLQTLGSFIFLTVVSLPWLLKLRRKYVRMTLSVKYKVPKDCKIVAFFHPYCGSGGGGERVLWTAIKAMCSRWEPQVLVIYTNDLRCFQDKQLVFESVKKTFSLSLNIGDKPIAIHFVRIITQPLLSPRLYPVFTLLGQALGSMVVALEALLRCPPDVFLDTVGFGFTLPVARWLAGAKTAAYVHYPTISSDMVDRITRDGKSEISLYNNAAWIRKSKIASAIKLVYYCIFTRLYKWAGSPMNLNVVMTNSSWTQNHISSLWGGKPTILYPPCPTDDLSIKAYAQNGRKPWIMSVGQFRPEKDHELQLRAFHVFLKRHCLLDKPEEHNFRLLLIGGCRDANDLNLVDKLRKTMVLLQLEKVVEFHINLPYKSLRRYLHECTINLHTMLDEHFGISVVEGMASGLITVAHNSGGPRADIIGPAVCRLPSSQSSGSPKPKYTGVGYLASSAEEYADTFDYILLQMTPAERLSIQNAARERAQSKFSEECFLEGWLKQMTFLGL
ncbi:unnamed protein product [Calicophoron daubneyi]|uniref:GDP-Man:Man(3)GlcNAc(2)-PP-Dol alpha-1,2-mannosyltransferase n=1 Tax=Calicophoron daubneyi TaxID=300641 RepID=A0AAV2T1V2_CALDB